MTQKTSQFLDAARQEANAAFEEHCLAWDELESIEAPTLQDIERWVSAKDNLHQKQDAFEKILRQIY